MVDFDLDALQRTDQDTRDDELIGANIARLRREKGWSQTALAESMRVAGHEWHQNTVSRIENAKQSLTFRELHAVSERLGDVLAGTTFEASIRRLGNAIIDRAIEGRLEKAQGALAEAARAIEEARRIYVAQKRGVSDGEHSEET